MPQGAPLSMMQMGRTKKMEVGMAITCDILEVSAQAKVMMIVVQMVSNLFVMLMVWEEVQAHYALCGLGNLLQTVWLVRVRA